MGVYMQRHIDPGGKLLTPAYPIVVSRNRNAAASLPPQHSIDTGTHRQESFAKSNASPEAIYAKEIPRQESNQETLWQYMTQFIDRTAIPNKGRVPELLNLPRRRSLKMNPARAHRGFREKSARDIAAMVIQLTGEKPPDICTRCRDGKGLFKQCIVIDRESNRDAKSRYVSCANCLYRGNQTYCSLKDWVVDREKPDTKQVPDEGPNLSARMISKPVSAVWHTSTEGNERPEAISADELAAPILNKDNGELGIQKLRSSRQSLRVQQSHPAQRSQLALPASSLIPAGALQPADILEMEPWEVAPGRIRDTSAVDPESMFLFPL